MRDKAHQRIEEAMRILGIAKRNCPKIVEDILGRIIEEAHK